MNPFSNMVAALTAESEEVPAQRRALTYGKAPNSMGVALSWTDPKVREGRLMRDAVQVTLPSGEVRSFRSVREAFRVLLLPDQKHVRFRLKLKRERVSDWVFRDGRAYRFELVPVA